MKKLLLYFAIAGLAVAQVVIPIEDGGTGAGTAANARANLGLGSETPTGTGAAVRAGGDIGTATGTSVITTGLVTVGGNLTVNGTSTLNSDARRSFSYTTSQSGQVGAWAESGANKLGATFVGGSTSGGAGYFALRILETSNTYDLISSNASKQIVIAPGGTIGATFSATGLALVGTMSASGVNPSSVAGNFYTGSAAALTSSSGLTPRLQTSSSTGQGVLLMQEAVNSTNAVSIYATKTRSGVIGNYTSAIQNGDTLFGIYIEGSDGISALKRGAAIQAFATGAFSPTSSPAQLSFWTTPSGSTAVAERLRIGSDGVVTAMGDLTVAGNLTVSGVGGLSVSADPGSGDTELGLVRNTNSSGGAILRISRSNDSTTSPRAASVSFNNEWYSGILRIGGSNTSDFSIGRGSDRNTTPAAVVIGTNDAVSLAGNLTVGGTGTHTIAGELQFGSKGSASVTRTGMNGVGAHSVFTVASDAKTTNDGPRLLFSAKDSGDATQTLGYIEAKITDPTAASEDSTISINNIIGGTLTEGISINATGVSLKGTSTVTGIRTATASLDFPSVAAGASQDLTITVTGAAVGDAVNVVCAAGGFLGNIVLQGCVTASNTVTVRACNFTAGAIDPSSSTIRATVISF